MPGRLVYVMGPSGSGKDTVLLGLQSRLDGCHLARRIITRPVEACEGHAASVSIDEFNRLEAQGALAMAWRANGLAYGISGGIDAVLDGGGDVLVNGSRAYLPQARARYANLLAVLLTVDPHILRCRLRARGRESEAEIDARMARNSRFVGATAVGTASAGGVFVIDNSGNVEQAVQSLVIFLQQARLCA
jgi:ribose 1,5-bisphosphokinase